MSSAAGMRRAEAAERHAALTEAQAGLWFAQSVEPDNPVFNTGQYVEIVGDLDVAAFAAAVGQVAHEADILAVRIVGPDRQTVDERNRPFLFIEDLRTVPDAERRALRSMRADMATALDMARGPLARQVLYRLGLDRAFWYLRLHHAITDGFATGLLTQRVADLYNRATAGAPASAGLVGLDSALAEDAVYRASTAAGADAAYWRDVLADMPDVAGLKAGQAGSAASYHHVGRPLAPALCEDLAALAQEIGIAWPDIITALTAAYVARHTGQNDVVVGVPFMGRFGSAAARVPVTRMNVLPLRLTVDEEASVAGWLRDGAGRIALDRRHGRYRGEWIRRDLGLVGGRRRLHGPLINVLPFDTEPAFAGLRTRTEILGTGPVDDATFSYRGGSAAERLRLEVDVNPRLHERRDANDHAARLEAFLSAAIRAARGGRAFRTVPTVTEAEHRWLVETLNDTDHAVPRTTLAHLLAESFERCAAREAVRFGARALSYAELDRRSSALAEALGESGAGRGAVVVVALPRSLDLIVALVAVIRVGAAYLPVDLSQPKARIGTILASARPAAALAEVGSGWPEGVTVLPPSAWPSRPAGRPVAGPSPESTAYIIYTSGSTGEPKGVMVGHQAIVNRLEWMREHYGFGPDDVVLQKTPMTFDVSVWEFFLSFLSGGRLVVAPPDAHRDPAVLAALIRREGITTAHFVPSMLSAFLADPVASGLRLRRVFCSGEELTAELRDRFHRCLEAELHNLYGPTEAAVDVTFWPATAADRSDPVPIGFPVWNTRLYVLDGERRPMPPGVKGDLYLAGIQLAQGYLGRDDLTSDRFVADPFHPGELMYRTGDLARIDRDGAVAYLGRSDHQIKLRGLRIELGEIEAALLSHPSVAQAVAVLHRDQEREGRIVAYVVLDRQGHADPVGLLDHVAGLLPTYMMPSSVVRLDALPVSSSGKLDRARLPVPVFAGRQGRSPGSANERLVAALFGQVLRTPGPLSVEDDFFALGGHSLLAVELARQLREAAGVDADIAAVFAHPTVRRLARHLDGRPGGQPDAGLQPLIRLNAARGERTPVFMLHPAGGLSWCYNRIARALGDDRSVWGVQAVALEASADAPASLDAMARDYAARIAVVAGGRRVHLLGWSVGGILAQAVAVHLRDAAQAVGVVAMLDAYPCECWRDQPDPGLEGGLKALLAIGGYDPDRLPDLPLTREAVVAFLRAGGSPLASLPPMALDGMTRVVGLTSRLVRTHVHRRYDGAAIHFQAVAGAAPSTFSPACWTPHVASLRVHAIPAAHAFMTGAEATRHIAPRLAEAIRDADKRD